MKNLITSEFLRGCLFLALLAQSFPYLANGIWLEGFPEFQPFQFFISLAMGMIFAALATGTLLAPARTSKSVFTFLAILCGIPFLSYYLRANTLDEIATGYSPHAIYLFIKSLIIYSSVAVLAYFHHRFTHSRAHAEQGAAANP